METRGGVKKKERECRVDGISRMETVSQASKPLLNYKWLLRNSFHSEHVQITCHQHAIGLRERAPLCTAKTQVSHPPTHSSTSLPYLTWREREKPFNFLCLIFSLPGKYKMIFFFVIFFFCKPLTGERFAGFSPSENMW